MESIVDQVIKDKLASFSARDKATLFPYLLLLGIAHYELLHEHSSVIDMHGLQYLCNKYIADLRKASSNMKQYNSVFIDPRSHVSIRKYRPDHMSHYPFADDKGAVEDVFRTDHSGNLQGLMNMGPPAQKRFLDKTFDEVKVSKDGMRLVDVCEALQRLGFYATTAFKEVLESTNPELFTSKPNKTHWRHYEQSSADRFITLSQWHFIVKRIMTLLKIGRKASDIVSVLPDSLSEATRMRRRKADSHRSFDDPSSDDDDDDCEGNEDYQVDRRGEMESKAEPGSPSKETGAVTRSARRRHARKEGRFMRQDLKQVSSRIGQLVRYDRNQYQKKTRERDAAALKTIARRRVDALTSTAVPLGFKDRHFFSEPDPGNYSSQRRHEPRLFHSVSNSMPHGTSGPSKSKSKTATAHAFKRYADLSSGLATMEIADAFLQGQVGREMLTRPDEDFSMYASSRPGEVYGEGIADPATAARTAAALRGRPIKPDADRRYAPNTFYTNDIREHSREEEKEKLVDQPSHADYDWRSLHDKRVEQKMNDRSKSLYSAPGWKSAKGGWVADFGAEHTHAFYTGPELDYPLFHRNSSSSRAKTADYDLKADGRDITRKSFEQQIAQQTVDLASAYSDKMREKALSRSEDGILDALVRRTGASLGGSHINSGAVDANHFNVGGNTATAQQVEGSGDSISVDSAVAGAGEGPVRRDYFHTGTVSSSED